MDFFAVKERCPKKGIREIYPDFKVCRSKDLMVRGKAFYAIWDEDKKLWSTDEYDVQRLVDRELYEYRDRIARTTEDALIVKAMGDFSSKSWVDFKKYLSNVSDNSHQLDERLTFANSETKKNDYISKKLPYPLEKGDYSAYDELIATLYEETERAKIEWAIGAIVSGDARNIQKFLVLYGEAGAGKSTILNIIQSLFQGYYTTFEAKALTASSNAFSTEVFRSNPLVAIQHDGDLSRIEDNTKLNSIVSHEEMTMNEKYKASYMSRINAFLFMATNRPVKITDAKSGIIRRLIDVKPSGKKIPGTRYQALMSQIQFELGAIAQHCLEVYHEMGKHYYDAYRPVGMMFQTDVFFNFVDENQLIFSSQDGIALKQAYAMYKEYCEEALVEFKLPMYKFREELKNYFQEFAESSRIDGKQVRSYYSGFLVDKLREAPRPLIEHPSALTLDSTDSLLDDILKDCPAQLASANETPLQSWEKVQTTLQEIDTKKLHYVKVPLNHIVIDFDLKNDKGEKDQVLNLTEASKWPATYAEFSKGGNGIHLHYIYDGDPMKLSRVYKDGIEVKVFNGGSSLRRKLSLCNTVPIAHISSGLPLKEEKVINFNAVKSEKTLRDLIERNLRKEIHPGTKPSIDFIKKILDDAYDSGMRYDLTTLRPKVLAFAAKSTNHADYCVRLVSQMPFISDNAEEEITPEENPKYSSDRLAIFDIEVAPNLLLICWKYLGDDYIHDMFNPTPAEVADFMNHKLVGFNCRRYDNHVVYGRYIGYDNDEIFNLSKKIIEGSPNAMFREAYNLSYTDVYDFCSKKQSLKKWEIELGIHHQEWDHPWDQPVDEKDWSLMAEYCHNDVIATEKLFNARSADWAARRILAKIAGMSPNETTQNLTAKIIFGDDPHPQDKFVYTDLSIEFPGYKFENGKSTYKGVEVGEGGRVYAKPGMYANTPVLDIASMHPSTAIYLNVFGPYTKNFEGLVDSRKAVKHSARNELENLLNGALLPFYDEAFRENGEYTIDDLAYALKIAINIVYGMTSAKFPNKFKDPRNIDNIVAKRGALFMIDLQEEVEKRGYTVAHIKTDSIKIDNATPEIIQFVQDYGQKRGYLFEHECTYDRMCLVNDAVYIAKYDNLGIRNKGGKHAGEWTATGAQFAQPYVFKTLFSKESIEFEDLCEAKAVSNSSMYLDLNEGLEDVSDLERDFAKLLKNANVKCKPNELERILKDYHDAMPELCEKIRVYMDAIAKGHKYRFVGKAGLFCPVVDGSGGGELVREKDGNYYAVTGTKDFRWLESETVETLGMQDKIDYRYYRKLVDEAVADISKYGDFEWFVS